jgi:hypothetical protein
VPIDSRRKRRSWALLQRVTTAWHGTPAVADHPAGMPAVDTMEHSPKGMTSTISPERKST